MIPLEPELIRPLKHAGKSDVWLSKWQGRDAVVKYGPGSGNEAHVLASGMKGLPELYEFQKHDNPMQSMVVRELFPGRSLARHCRDNPMDAITILNGIARLMVGLYDHTRDLPFIHGDISPDNIIVHGDEVHLVDFENSGWGSSTPAHALKVGFAAPEVIANKVSTVAGDIFSLGRTIQYCGAKGPVEILSAMTANDPSERPESWGQLLKVLSPWILRDKPETTP